jgi:hypothetical protein
MSFDTLWQLQPMTETEKAYLVRKAIQTVANYADDVPRITLANLGAYDKWQWQTKYLIYFATAYDFLRATGTPEDSLAGMRQSSIRLARELYDASTAPVSGGLNFFSVAINNHALMVAGALGLAAVVFNDHQSVNPLEQPINWLHCSLYQIDRVLFKDPKRQSEPGRLAGYAESPYYMVYGLQNCFPFFQALRRVLPDQALRVGYKGDTVVVRHPFYDPNLELLYEWADRIRMPDGRIPPIDDTYLSGTWNKLALTGKPDYHWPFDTRRWLPAWRESYGSMFDDAFDARAFYLALNLPYDPIPDEDSLFQALPEAGNLVFRSGWDVDAVYAHVTAENGRARIPAEGHNQGDASSYLLYAYGQLLLIDPGYSRYSVRETVGKAENHNLILVDGCGPSIGQPFNSADADAFIDLPIDLPALDVGRVRTRYCNADIERVFALVDNRHFVVLDYAQSLTTPRSFTQQVHGMGVENGGYIDTTGVYWPDANPERARWEVMNAGVVTHVTAVDGIPQYQTTVMQREKRTGTFENYNAYRGTTAPRPAAQFITVATPYRLGIDSVPQTQTLAYAPFAAVAYANGLHALLQAADTLVTLSSVQTGWPLDLTSDARGIILRPDSLGKLERLLLYEGNELRFGTHTVVRTNKRQTIAWNRTDATTFRGYVSAGGKVQVLCAQPVVSVDGALAFGYDAQSRRLNMTFQQAGYFTVRTMPGQALPWDWNHAFTDTFFIKQPVDTTDTDTTDTTVSIKRPALPIRLLAIPNPVSDHVVEIRGLPGGKYFLELINLMGQVVARRSVEAKTGSGTVFSWPPGVSAGLYTLRCTDQNPNSGIHTQPLRLRIE